jgi:hypothetical protein
MINMYCKYQLENIKITQTHALIQLGARSTDFIHVYAVLIVSCF